MVPRLPVLVYHDVCPEEVSSDALTLTPEAFARQIGFLARAGYHPIRVAEWLAHAKHGAPLPDNPVLLTLDDGYATLAEHALPILRQYGFPAVVFVITGVVGRRSSPGRKPAMSAGEIRRWMREGIEFGCHTRSHRDLRSLDSAVLRDEIEGSRVDLAAITGVAPTAFAYPFGAYDEAALSCARACFPASFSTDAGLNSSAQDPARLRRAVVLRRDSLLAFACTAATGWNLEFEARERLHLRRRAGAIKGLGMRFAARTTEEDC
jgi:peptidoglycan/xylan/chitin deacetylase (PgdA/CDA1 family)